jgi:hypothetical protein
MITGQNSKLMWLPPLWDQALVVATGRIAMSELPRAHWDNVYRTKPTDSVSWYQPSPDGSLAAIARTGVSASAPVIDVGIGASVLVDSLLARGFTDLTVLDTAGPALDCQIASKRDPLFASYFDPLTASPWHGSKGFGVVMRMALLEGLERREGAARPEFQPLQQQILFPVGRGVSCGS